MYNTIFLYQSGDLMFFFFAKCLFQCVSPDGVVKVSNTVLEKTNADLKSLRMSVFKQLKPKLRCKLGERSEFHGMFALITESHNLLSAL